MPRIIGKAAISVGPGDYVNGTSADQNRMLGAMLGMAIGDALGMPVVGLTPAQIRERYGHLDRYLPRVFDDGTEIGAGEFTDESEIALCIVESLTTNRGEVNPELIGARMIFLARGESKRWIHPDTLAALDRADESREFIQPLRDDGPVTADLAARGIPIGLLHAVGNTGIAAMLNDAETVTRITHGNPAAIDLVSATALAMAAAARGLPPTDWIAAVTEALPAGAVRRQLAGQETGGVATELLEAIRIAGEAATFADAIVDAANLGGEADTRGSVAGALAGARLGAEGIPQRWIDDLEGRIYVSLAAPWFYKAAQRRAGRLIDLRPE